ncbi:tRNA(Ile)-lysidine synthase [Eubacterium ruminantium]|nr:tRNA(Ile)-lysidine synthase [Eubacterium ruminantium]
MNFTDKVREYIIEHSLLEENDGVVVGLSGGADSVSLLLSLIQLKDYFNLKIVAVHINHMIRGEEAERDQNFAENLCRKHSIECITKCINIPEMAREKHLTEEECGRIVRYEEFEKVRKEKGFKKIAVAHNLDDQAETVIFNMVRGSSIKGLSGIPVKRGNVIRPLLGISRNEIEDYLRKEEQEYVTDSTNLQVDYSRNIVRHLIIPEMKKLNSGAAQHISSAAGELSEMYDILRCMTDEVDVRKENSEIYINISSLSKKPKIVRKEAYLRALEELAGKRKDITGKHLSDIDMLLEMKNGSSIDLPYRIKIRKSYEDIIFYIPDTENRFFEVEISGDDKYYIEGNEYIIKKAEYRPETEIPTGDHKKMIDADKVKGRLVIRNVSDDDVIKISVDGYKKLKRLFIDCKVDREKRKNYPVLADDKEVIWAFGLRLSEAYKVDKNTKNVYYIELRQNASDMHTD